MKDILLSVRPKWCEKILSGEKIIEVRKSAPKEVPFRVFIYCTNERNPNVLLKDKDNRFSFGDYRNAYTCDVNGNVDFENVQGKIIGDFICDNVDKFVVGSLYSDGIQKEACLSYKELINYFYNGNPDGTVRIGYGWHISDLKIYDKPKFLNEITPFCNIKGELCEGCSHYVEAFGGCCKTLKRPPQSYCYVGGFR